MVSIAKKMWAKAIIEIQFNFVVEPKVGYFLKELH